DAFGLGAEDARSAAGDLPDPGRVAFDSSHRAAAHWPAWRLGALRDRRNGRSDHADLRHVGKLVLGAGTLGDRGVLHRLLVRLWRSPDLGRAPGARSGAARGGPGCEAAPEEGIRRAGSGRTLVDVARSFAGTVARCQPRALARVAPQ